MDATALRRRDFKVIGLVGTAHGFSHFYQLALPPLFPLIHEAEGIGYTELGLLVAVMYTFSGVLQPPAGFLVDRFGARRILPAGLAVMAAGTALYAVAPNYETMLVCAALAGIGNSVFHPCDYSVLSVTVSEQRVGRAFSLHMFGGYVGYGLAPILMARIGAVAGWQTAAAVAGLAGFVMLGLLIVGSGDFRDSRHERSRDDADGRPEAQQSLGVLTQAPIVLCWVFFFLVAMGQIGLQTKTPSILTLPGTYGLDVETGGLIVSVMLFAVPLGILLGGLVADRTRRHDAVIGFGYGIAALLMLLLWQVRLPLEALIAAYLVTGICYGIAFPSRDVLVRRLAPRGASGKVFGFVYSGMDVGSMITPVLFGWFIDRGIPMTAFLFIAGLWLASIFVIRATALSTARHREAHA